jgi:hypothetical protein
MLGYLDGKGVNRRLVPVDTPPGGPDFMLPLRGMIWEGRVQQFSLWTIWGHRVRAPGLQEGAFAGYVGPVPSPGGGLQGHNENCWSGITTHAGGKLPACV